MLFYIFRLFRVVVMLLGEKWAMLGENVLVLLNAS